jgi:hypothetical protein
VTPQELPSAEDLSELARIVLTSNDPAALLAEWRRFNSMQASVRMLLRHPEIRKRLGLDV